MQISHATHETLFIITLVLLFCGFKKKSLSSFGSPTWIKASFPFILLLTASLPLYLYSIIVTTVIAPIAVLIGWIFVIAPLWRVTSKTSKIVAGILSYPGAFLIGGWPLTFAPGILALPFGWWRPAPSMSIQLKAIGNIKGFESSLLLDSFSLILWVLIFVGLSAYRFSENKANKTLKRTP